MVDPPAEASPAADDRSTALLRRARALGVTTFDVADARFPNRAERLIARAFPAPDPEVGVVVGRSVESLAPQRTPGRGPVSASDLESGLAESLQQSRRRLSPVPIALVDWDPSTAEAPSDLSEPPSMSPPASGTPEFLWAVRLPSPATSLPTFGRDSTLFSGTLSLLQPDLVPLFESKDRPPEASLIARDPFSSGRLDGSRFASRAALAGPRAPPVDLRQLHQEFDPVLRLGFLTEGHRRTLAQAALQFVLHWPWVASVVVPLPEPERFDEVLGFGSRPPLSSDELARLSFLK